MEFRPVWYRDALKLINPAGHAGLITLWTPQDRYVRRLKESFPALLGPSSPLVLVSSLYGNGLAGMLVNLAANPQVERLAVTGSDLTGGAACLVNFFARGVEPAEDGGLEMRRIVGTHCLLPPGLEPEKFWRRPEIACFPGDDLEGIVRFLQGPPKTRPREEDRVRIELPRPDYREFPSDLASHSVRADSPLDAWMDAVHLLWRYGESVAMPYPARLKRLLNVSLTLRRPEYETPERLREFGFDPKSVDDYRRRILEGGVPDGLAYAYGDRLRAHWGADLLETVAGRLKREPRSEISLISLWDNRDDLLEGRSFPCLSDLFFVYSRGALSMQAGFRAWDALHAMVANLHGLIAIQKLVCGAAGLPQGPLHVRARWLQADAESPQAGAALALIDGKRRKGLDVDDPRGHFTVFVEDGEIVARHHSPSGVPMEEFRGGTAEAIRGQVRGLDVFSNTDHAVWFGRELALAESALANKHRGGSA